MLEYSTPDEVPAGTTCRVLFIPDNELFLGAVRGALQTLTDPDNWEKYGDLTTQEAADAMFPMFDSFCLNEGECAE